MSRKSRNTHDVLCVSHQIATKSLKLFTVFGGVRSLAHFMKLNWKVMFINVSVSDGGVLIKYFMTQCIKLKQISEELFPLIAIMLSFQFWVRHLDVSTNQGNKNQDHEHFTFFIQKLKNRGCMDGRACHDFLFIYSKTERVSSGLRNVAWE